jgi:hypothetical protein
MSSKKNGDVADAASISSVAAGRAGLQRDEMRLASKYSDIPSALAGRTEAKNRCPARARALDSREN